MWKFRFAALLEIRRKAEREHQVELARALGLERRLLATIADFDALIAQQYAAWGARGSLVSIAREATFESRISRLHSQREALRPELTSAAAAIAAAGAQLEIAARARAAIERLETRARTEHVAKLALSEALALEDSNILRAVRGLRERTR